MQIDEKSRAKLRGVHRDLVRVIERAALDGASFRVIEGLRTIERQRQLVAQGASKTLNSRHITGHAVDVVPLVDGEVSWAWPAYHPLAAAIKAAAKAEGVPITWGGDWAKFRDGPHWELPRKQYPAVSVADSEPPAGGATKRQAAVKAASLYGTGSAAGAGLSDLAGQLQPFADYSETIRWVFVGLMLASVAYGVWSWWRTQE